MTNHWFFWLFLVLYLIHELWEIFLDLLNLSHIRQHRLEIPSFFKGRISSEQHQKSVCYSIEKIQFFIFVRFLQIPLIWGLIIFGGFEILDKWILHFVQASTLTHSVVYCLAVAFIVFFLKIPISAYADFVIEAKYGFNKTTLKIFVTDIIKGILLGVVLAVPLFYFLFWLFEKAGSYWWVGGFSAVFLFQLLIVAIYPSWIAPLFNKFVPLPNGNLKERILKIAQKIQFKMSGIFTIDGSKRSSHSNAYFAGLGRFRRIVLFDTLLKQLSENEIVSVLTHEMGHNKMRHIQKQMILSFLATLVGFWILSILINWEPFFITFNAGAPSVYKAFVLFSFFSGYFTFVLTPIENYLSRKNEYEADQFSVKMTENKESMISSLLELSKENLTNLTPHPWYSFYHHSHPTVEERVMAIEKQP